MSLMKFIQFRIGDIVQMKKKHPCGSQEWEVMQLGSDMRVKCCGCGHIVLIPRPKFLKGAKKVLNRDVTQDTPLASRSEESTEGWGALYIRSLLLIKSLKKNTCKVRIPML